MNVAATGKISLLLVDDHALFRESLARLLQAESEFEVVAHCASNAEALRLLKTRKIDVVLLDLDLGQERGIDLLDALQAIRFGGKVLLVTADVSDKEVPSLIRKGIAGIMMKHNSPELLVQGIRDAMKGKVWFDQGLLKRAFDGADPATSEPHHSGLTDRERKVLSSVFEGRTNKEIANQLQISESAVKSSMQNLFTKTGVRTRSQLVRVALEQYRDEL